MVVKFSEGLISGELMTGKAVVNAPVGVKVAISTPDGVSASDGKEASVVAVSTQRGVRCVPIVTAQTSSATTALSSGALAAILLGAGGSAVAGAVVSSQQASGTTP